MKHILSINDLSADELYNNIIPACEDRIAFAKEREPLPYCPKKKLTIAALEPSTRTRGTYAEAGRLLGWHIHEVIGEEATSLAKNESIANTARQFAIQGADVLAIRNKVEGAPKFIAEILEEEGYDISVQNAGDGANQHPTQTYLDLLTIKTKLGRLDDFKIGFFGDLRYSRTVPGLISALALRKNIKVTAVSAPDTALQDHRKKLIPEITEGYSLELLSDCDVIYGSRLQTERFEDNSVDLQRAIGKLQITQAIINQLKPGAMIMHAQPYVHEISPKVRRNQQIIIDYQAWCAIPTRIFCLDEGYENRKKRVLNDSPGWEIKKTNEMSINEYWEKRKKKKANYEHFRPIQNGTVIDHIPNGLGLKIRNFLADNGRLNGGVKHTIEDVPSRRYGVKDVLVLDQIYINQATMRSIGLFAPTITFNVIQDSTFRQFTVKGTGAITGIGKCPNNFCISNKDPEAESKFSHNGDIISCYYCEKQYMRHEVI